MGGSEYRNRLWRVMTHIDPNLFPYKYPNILKPSHTSYLPACEDGTECSETPAYKIQTPGNYPGVILKLSSNLVTFHTYLPMKKEQTQCSETLAYKIQMPGDYPAVILPTFLKSSHISYLPAYEDGTDTVF